MSSLSLKEITFHQERKRAVAQGILETAGSTFLMVIAVQWYHCTFYQKSILASATNAGMLLSVFVVGWIARRQWQVSQAAAGFSLIGGIAFLISALFPSVSTLIFGSVLGLVCASCLIPLMTQLYENHYPKKERGQLFSQTIRYRILSAIFFSQLFGYFIQENLNQHPSLLALYALSLLAMTTFLKEIPSKPLHPQDSSPLLASFRHLKKDSAFRWTLYCWMILGFANLMMVALRVDFLANPRYEISLSASQIALYLGVIPNIARFLMSGLWGWLFDHLDFYRLRMILNLSFVVSILAFFTGESQMGFLLGAIFYGIGIAGGDVAWSLWVTKFSPSEHVAEYMSIHTFLTGVRGVIAPWVGFWIVEEYSMNLAAWISATMIITATLMMFHQPKNLKTNLLNQNESGL